MAKSPLKAPLPGSHFFTGISLLSVANINLHFFHGKRSGLLQTAKFKGIVSLTV